MSFFNKIFGSKSSNNLDEDENFDQVEVHFQIGDTDLDDIFDLEEQLADAVETSQVGEFGGNEIAVDGTDGFYYMFGPDAKAMFKVVAPILENCSFMQGAEVSMVSFRNGEPSSSEEMHVVKSQS